MKKTIFILTIMVLFSFSVSAQTKKDGTPDMRYKANKQSNVISYSAPKTIAPLNSTPKTERNYNNGGQIKVQSGYQKGNGTYIAPHIKTTPDNKTYNNLKPKYK